MSGTAIEEKATSSKFIWVKVQLSSERWVFVSTSGPNSEKYEEENETFCIHLNECVVSFCRQINLFCLTTWLREWQMIW